MTCTEFFPPSWFAARARLREAEEVIDSLLPRLQPPQKNYWELESGTTVFQSPEVFRCANCDTPQQVGNRVVKVPNNIKQSDPPWYVKHQMAYHAWKIIDGQDQTVKWCEGCLRMLGRAQ